MATQWEQQIRRLFPGSSTPLDFEAVRTVQTEVADLWDKTPKIFAVRGVETEFFSIGQLSLALNRSPNTIRAWEKEGILPKSPYVKPSDDVRGRRRMYTRPMVEGLIRICKEEKMYFPSKGFKISGTQFTAKAIALFKSLT